MGYVTSHALVLGLLVGSLCVSTLAAELDTASWVRRQDNHLAPETQRVGSSLPIYSAERTHRRVPVPFISLIDDESSNTVDSEADQATSDSESEALIQVSGEEQSEGFMQRKHREVIAFFQKPADKGSCVILSCILLFFCCCGGALKDMIGQSLASFINLVATVTILVYLLQSGTYQQWWKGATVGPWCTFLCIWAFLFFIFWSCVCCCTVCFLGTTFFIRNEVVKHLRSCYDKKEPLLSGPRRACYQSPAFREKCDKIFEKADADGSGSLDMKELEQVVKDYMGENAGAMDSNTLALFAMAFDDNGDSTVEKHEFVEMMKCFSVMTLKEDTEGRPEGQTLQHHYEILRVPDNATASEVSRAYRQLAREYHPDKRYGVSKEVADRDISEINNAKDELIKHLDKKDGKSDDGTKAGV